MRRHEASMDAARSFRSAADSSLQSLVTSQERRVGGLRASASAREMRLVTLAPGEGSLSSGATTCERYCFATTESSIEFSNRRFTYSLFSKAIVRFDER